MPECSRFYLDSTHPFPTSPSVHVHRPCPLPLLSLTSPPPLSLISPMCTCPALALLCCLPGLGVSGGPQRHQPAGGAGHTPAHLRRLPHTGEGEGDMAPHVAHWCPVPLLIARDCWEGCSSSCPALWLVVTIYTLCLAPSLMCHLSPSPPPPPPPPPLLRPRCVHTCVHRPTLPCVNWTSRTAPRASWQTNTRRRYR